MQKGFTFIELIIVLTILGLLSSVGLSKFSSTSSFKERGFTDGTLTSFRYAHKLANTSGCHVSVVLNNTNLKLSRWPACKPADHSVVTSLIRNPNNSGGFSNATPTGILVSSIDFYFDGTGKPFTTSSESALTSVTNISIGSRTIKLEPETGFTHL
jgi:prepilin-type N-terminal cleavage/methylation domain-containing protein